jgi:hypothetical protein
MMAGTRGSARVLRRAGRSAVTEAVTLDMANPAWDEACARILIVRLSTWKDVDISTPHLVLFDEARRALPDAFIDFAFLPSAGGRKSCEQASIPWFCGLASGRPPRDFDLVMVSNAFALELVNLPWFFATAGIPLLASARESEDDLPIVIAGGSNASAMGATVLMPDPRSGTGPALDSICDGIFFGEGEGSIGKLAGLLCSPDEADRRSRAARGRRIAQASSIEGFWPCRHSRGATKVLAEGRPNSLVSPLVLDGEGAGSARLAITSGCPGYCSFCLEGWERRPYREAPLPRLLNEARRIRKSTGAADLEIYSFNFNTHEDIFELLYGLNLIFRHVSFMSQRLDILADIQGLAEAEFAGGKRSYTLGIEGISSRMRAFYRKGLQPSQLDTILERILIPGVRELKLFYIISGDENTSDLAEFASFMKLLESIRQRRSPATRILASAGFLVRLPFTPLQYSAPEFDREKLQRIAFRMREACQSAGIDFRSASDIEESFVDQGLSTGGNAAFRWLETVVGKGFVYDSSLPKGAWKSLEAFFAGPACHPGFFGEKDGTWRPPLAFLERSEDHETLYSHYLMAKGEKDRAPCLGAGCEACGICENGDDIRAMTGHQHRVPPLAGYLDRLRRLMAAKSAFTSVPARIEYPEELAFSSEAYRMSWIMRSICARIPGAESVVFECRETLCSQNGRFSMLSDPELGRWGSSAIALYGPDPARISKLLGRLGKSAVQESGLHGAEALPFALEALEAVPSPGSVEVSIMLCHEGPEAMPGSAGHPELPVAESLKRMFEGFMTAGKLAFTTKRKGEDCEWTLSATSKGRNVLLAAAMKRMESGPGREGCLELRMSLGERADPAPLFSDIEAFFGIRPAMRIVGWQEKDRRS